MSLLPEGQAPQHPRKYGFYESKKKREKLNLNQTTKPPVVFPRNIYDGPLYNTPYYWCDKPRDKESMYLFGVERDRHPDHFSRYGYAKNRNGYGIGTWVGRYIVPEGEDYDPQPPNMAPPLYYTDAYQGPGVALYVGEDTYRTNPQRQL
jgi:hypothetical protein